MGRENIPMDTEDIQKQPPRIRVALVASYSLLTEALRLVLSEFDDIEVVGEGGAMLDAFDLLKDHNPDVILMEFSDSSVDELDLIGRIVAAGRGSKVLILSMDTSEQLALRMLRTGAHGILSRGKSSEKVVEAIRKVQNGEVYLTPELQRLCAERYLGVGRESAPEEQLSNREYQVLRFLASGYTNREIAKKLGIGVKTVDTHRANLLRKLNLRNNSDITRFAIKKGLIEI